MNTLREQNGYPPKYINVTDTDAPALISNQGRLLISDKPANSGPLSLMCADQYVKLPYHKADKVRINNFTGKEIGVSRTWTKETLGDFDSDPYEDGKSINGINGWQGNGTTTPDSRSDLRAPVLDILQGRRSVLIKDKITKHISTIPADGSKFSSLVRPRAKTEFVGLGIYDSGDNLILGVGTVDDLLFCKKGQEPTSANAWQRVTHDILRFEINLAPSVGYYRAYVYQGDNREIIDEGYLDSLKSDSLNYNSSQIGAEGVDQLVDQFQFYSFGQGDFEILPTSSSSVFPVSETSDEICIKNLGSNVQAYEDKTESVYITGYYVES